MRLNPGEIIDSKAIIVCMTAVAYKSKSQFISLSYYPDHLKLLIRYFFDWVTINWRDLHAKKELLYDKILKSKLLIINHVLFALTQLHIIIHRKLFILYVHT